MHAARPLVPAGEAIAEAEAGIATERRITDGFLILLVEKIGDAAVEREAARKIITGGEVEARVTRIAGDAEAKEIAVGATAAEVAGDIEIEAAIVGVEPDVAGIHRAAQEMVSRGFRSIKGIGRDKDAAVVVGIVARQAKPMEEVHFGCDVDATSASEVRIKKVSPGGGTAGRLRNLTRTSWKTRRKAD